MCYLGNATKRNGLYSGPFFFRLQCMGELHKPYKGFVNRTNRWINKEIDIFKRLSKQNSDTFL